MKRQRPRSSLDINSPRGCIRIGFARIPRPSRPGRYGNLNRLPIIRRKHIDYLLLRIIHHLIDVTAYIGCIDIDVIRDLRNRCLTCKTCQYQTCKDTCQNTVLIFWTLPVFFIVENPALRHRLRTREKPHLQAERMIPQAKYEKQAESLIFL